MEIKIELYQLTNLYIFAPVYMALRFLKNTNDSILENNKIPNSLSTYIKNVKSKIEKEITIKNITYINNNTDKEMIINFNNKVNNTDTNTIYFLLTGILNTGIFNLQTDDLCKDLVVLNTFIRKVPLFGLIKRIDNNKIDNIIHLDDINLKKNINKYKVLTYPEGTTIWYIVNLLLNEQEKNFIPINQERFIRPEDVTQPSDIPNDTILFTVNPHCYENKEIVVTPPRYKDFLFTSLSTHKNCLDINSYKYSALVAAVINDLMMFFSSIIKTYNLELLEIFLKYLWGDDYISNPDYRERFGNYDLKEIYEQYETNYIYNIPVDKDYYIDLIQSSWNFENGNGRLDKSSSKQVKKEKRYLPVRKCVDLQVFDLIEREYKSRLKSAIISILVDSFAHNIAAHALNVIIEWLRRGVKLDEKLVSYMYKFLKYLEGKSTFWSGIIRETVIGGQILNWYELLLEFTDNPLFIGTIAGTEDIYKVDFYVKVTSSLLFLSVDASGMKEEKGKMEQKDYPFDVNIKNELEEKYVFLPGGEVGKHSLYTIFENILRNIKWAEKEIKEGEKKEKKIKFVIEIKDDNSKSYVINVWIANQTELGENENGVIKYINKKLHEPVIDNLGRPKLGGTYQSKICACQLFTNVFDEVENRYLEKYPWIEVRNETTDTNKGYIVWSFKMWKGEKLGYFDKESKDKEKKLKLNKNGLLIEGDKIIDNLRRYKIVVAKNEEEKNKIESLGVVRVVKNESIKDKTYEEYYKEWLNEWLEEWKTQEVILKIKQDGTSMLCINNNWEGKKKNCNKMTAKIELNFIHGDTRENESLFYRNHGILVGKLLNDNKVMDIAETILTKVLIIDDRVNQIIKRYKKDTKVNNNELWNKLNFEVKGEDESLDSVKKKFNTIHLLVIHLGYIEKQGCKEDNIDKFIKNHVCLDKRPTNELEENKFYCKKFIITTGRGRSNWYTRLLENKEYRGKILFVSPEAVVNAISKGVSIKDDFEIKYGLIKLLMQS